MFKQNVTESLYVNNSLNRNGSKGRNNNGQVRPKSLPSDILHVESRFFQSQL